MNFLHLTIKEIILNTVERIKLMGFRFKKSVKLGKHARINFNKNSVSTTFGIKGMHYTINSNGKRTKSVGIPGTGLYYTKSNNKGNKKSKNTKNVNYEDISMNNKNMNPIVYFIITFFFGMFGIHKFIDKKIGLGILYLFTAGLFGFGWIIDLIKALILMIQSFESNNSNPNTNQSSFENSDNNFYNSQNDRCKYCGGIIDEQTKKCVECGKSNDTNNLKIILWLIFFCPVGLYLMFTKTDWKKAAKIAISTVCACWILFCTLIFCVALFSDTPSKETITESTTSSIETTASTTEAKTTITTTENTTVEKETTIQAVTETTTQTTTKKATTTTTTQPTTTKEEYTQEKKSGITVYTAPTGKKYHYSKACAGENARERDLSDVQGIYEPCKKCAS